MRAARPRWSPRTVVYLVAATMALALSYGLVRRPIQVSDSLGELIDAQQSPSLYSTFVTHSQRGAYLRPLRLVQIKALFDLTDGPYWIVFRGFHALLLTAALFLFVRALRVQTWLDFAAAAFALTVLVGLHTFRGTLREAFPINHFLEIVVFCLIALNLVQARGRWWIDLAAAATFVVASLTLESGLLVWIVIAAAWACGMRGVSRRGVAAITILLAAYMWIRFGLLAIGTPGLEERASGFGMTVLEADEVIRRFGTDPARFYVYNVVTSFLSVLFSEPDGGVFEIARAWMQGGVPPRLLLALTSSTMATILIGWAAATRLKRRTMDRGAQLLFISAAVLAANSVLSYAYTKHEIISTAGAFYAVAAFVAARHAIDDVGSRPASLSTAFLVAVLAVTASLWAFRSAGVHHMLQVQAFKQRNDWVYAPLVAPPGEESAKAAARVALVRQLRHEALEMRVPNPRLQPRWMDRWWGE